MHKHVKFAVLFCILLLSMNTQANVSETSDSKENGGWEWLFDGSDLSHWRNFKQKSLSDKWQVQSGELVLTAKNAGDIVTKKQYSDFELQLDWKISAIGNSGILLRADELGSHVYSHALEVQILDNERHPDNKLATHLSGSLYDLQASPVNSHKPAEQWNHLRIVFVGKKLKIWQNDVQTVDIVIGSDDWNQRLAKSKFSDWPNYAKNETGYIGLQDHGDSVAFKNIKIKTL